MAKILVVEDDVLLNNGIALVLEKKGHFVIKGFSYSEGYLSFLNGNIDLILLDINLPDNSGINLCTEIRKVSQVPIIYLTANDTEQDIVTGFKTGCDDYISKPFSIEVLNQRIQAILRRIKPEGKNLFHSGDISVDYEKRLVTKATEVIKLTVTEYKLLELITQNSGQVMTRQLILERLWDVDEAFVDENALSVNIRRLRQKIEDVPKNPRYIKTVFGIGYAWGE